MTYVPRREEVKPTKAKEVIEKPPKILPPEKVMKQFEKSEIFNFIDASTKQFEDTCFEPPEIQTFEASFDFFKDVLATAPAERRAEIVKEATFGLVIMVKALEEAEKKREEEAKEKEPRVYVSPTTAPEKRIEITKAAKQNKEMNKTIESIRKAMPGMARIELIAQKEADKVKFSVSESTAKEWRERVATEAVKEGKVKEPEETS